MCCCNIIDVVGKYFKTSVAVTVFFFIAGVILLVFGVVLMTSMDGCWELKEAVEGFDATPIQAWTGTINGSQATVKSVSFNTKCVSSFTSVFTEANVPLEDDSSSDLSFTLNINTVQEFTRTVSRGVLQDRTIECSRSSCPSSRKPSNCDTVVSDFQNECISSGGNFTPTVPWCTIDSQCGTCTQYMYLSGLHPVAREISPGEYKEDSTRLSAIYPFGVIGNNYQAQKPSSVVVRLYSNKDPFIQLQRLTKGTGQFYQPWRIPGIVRVVIGVLLLLLAIGLCGLLIGFCVRRKQYPTIINSGQPIPSNQAATDAPGYAAPNGYGQPQQPQSYGYGQLSVAPPEDYVYGQPPLQGYPRESTKSPGASFDISGKK